jgi:predicted GNAT family acetyltransferase
MIEIKKLKSTTMEEVKLNLDQKGHGAFLIMDGAAQMGEMVVSITGKNLTVYHTEVVPEAEGKGLAKQLLNAMVQHARKNELKVIPLCPYVHAQFKRHPDEYADVWNRDSQVS